MTTTDLIDALKRKEDVGPLLGSFDKRVLYQQQVLVALQCHYTETNLNAFEQHGFELHTVSPSVIWMPEVDPEFFKKYLLAVRNYPIDDSLGHTRSERIGHSFIVTLCFQIFTQRTHENNWLDQYLTLFEHTREVFGDAYLYSLCTSHIYYDYGEHWTDKHWTFYNTYCTKNLEWDTDLICTYERPLGDKNRQDNLLNFVAQDTKLSTLWNTLEQESLERQKIFEEFLPQLKGGRAAGKTLPFFCAHVQDSDEYDDLHPQLAEDLDTNTVVNMVVDRILGFDLPQVYQHVGLRFRYFDRLNNFIPKLVFPSFQHKRLAGLDKFATTLDPSVLFDLLQHPMTRRNCLEGATVSDVRHILKHPKWMDWRDDVGNTFAHLLLGFSQQKTKSWVRLIATRAAWMHARNAAGFTPRDVLAENCGEGDLELYDQLLLRNNLKGVKRTKQPKQPTKRKI